MAQVLDEMRLKLWLMLLHVGQCVMIELLRDGAILESWQEFRLKGHEESIDSLLLLRAVM